jgi:hypothetical protein
MAQVVWRLEELLQITGLQGWMGGVKDHPRLIYELPLVAFDALASLAEWHHRCTPLHVPSPKHCIRFWGANCPHCLSDPSTHTHTHRYTPIHNPLPCRSGSVRRALLCSRYAIHVWHRGVAPGLAKPGMEASGGLAAGLAGA